MRRFVLVSVVLCLSACNTTSTAPSSRATILRHDPATVHASTKPTTQRTEWSVFEYRTFLDGRGGRLPFRILYPLNYDRNKPGGYPLILFLHGAGERGTDNERQLIHGSKMFIKPENREKFPAIVIVPQCPPNGWWAEKPAVLEQEDTKKRFIDAQASAYPNLTPEPTELTRRVHDLVLKILAGENVDRSRTYVMGLSMGGMGTFEMIARYPEMFAAAVPICGGGPTQATRRFKREVALWITHGDADNVIPVEWSRAVVKSLEVQDYPPRYTEFRGTNHNAWDPTFAMPELLPWLFSQKKVSHR